MFRQVATLKRDALLNVLSTITSLVFSEFVLEVGRIPPDFCGSSSEHWGPWKAIDSLLETKFARYGSFRLIIRAGELGDREAFERHAKETFRLLAKRGRLHFETLDSIESYWPPLLLSPSPG